MNAELQSRPVGARPLKLRDATLYLASRARARTPLGAAEFLGRSLDHGRKTYDKRVRVCLDEMDVYREIFPAEYRRSQAPPFSTRREHELYRLVNLRLFPLLLGEDVDLETHLSNEPQFFLPFIPVRGIQRHMWAGGCFHFQQIETVFKLAQVLSWMTGAGGRGWHALKLYFGVEGVEDPAPPVADVGWSMFVHSCAVDDSPLKHLPLAFHLISYKTGCPWLDLPQIGYVGFEWSVEEVNRLALARLWAKGIELKTLSVSSWLDEAPAERIAHVVRLWNRAAAIERSSGSEGMDVDDLVKARGARPLGGGLVTMRMPATVLDQNYFPAVPSPEAPSLGPAALGVDEGG